MKKLLLLLLLPASLHAQHYYKKFYGTLTPATGKALNIVMDIDRHDTLLFGNYYYEGKGQTISIDGSISPSGKAKLTEMDGMGHVTGRFEGTLSGSDFTGTWSNDKSTYTFRLSENYPAGSIRLLSGAFDSTSIVRLASGMDDAIAAYYHSDYLVADGPDKTTQARINSVLYKDYISGQPPKSWDTAAVRRFMARDGKAFLTEYRQTYDTLRKTTPRDDFESMLYSFNWSAEASMSVKFNEQNLLCITTIASGYTGGAHGMYGCLHQVISTKTGDTVALAQLFKPWYEPKLTQLAELALRKQYEVAPGTTLSEAGFFVDHLSLNNNFYITRGGIGFYYNPYEITPWAMGPVDLFLPWSDLKDLIAPKGPAGWALK